MTDEVPESIIQFIGDLGKLVASEDGDYSRFEEIPAKYQTDFKRWARRNVIKEIRPKWRAAWRLQGRQYILVILTRKIKELKDSYLKEKSIEDQDSSNCNLQVDAK